MTMRNDSAPTAGVPGERATLSVFVVSYNRSALLRTCLKALAFADEIIVVDKSSTDDSVAVATGLADRVISVPWSPTVEETRGFALAQCRYDWVLCLDDDECLSPEAVVYIDRELHDPRADIYCLPLRHYILGRHEERAYYWPERHPRLFRRGCVTFRDTVHAGVVLLSGSTFDVPADAGVCIHHLSHRDTAEWIAKTNRYTSRPDRAGPDDGGNDLIGFAHGRIDFWMARSRDSNLSDYPAAVALLRAVYDMIDRVKTWEAAAGLDGSVLFARVSQRLEAAYAAQLAPLARRRRRAEQAAAEPIVAATDETATRHLRTVQALATALQAAKDDREKTDGAAVAERSELVVQLAAAREELAAMHASTLWRLAGPLRRLGTRFPWLARSRRRVPAPPRTDESAMAAGSEARAALSSGTWTVEPEKVEPESIRFPPASDPVASVIVPTFGHIDYALNCLAAMARALPAVPIEVIVVDDASPDPEAARLLRVRGIRLLRHKENVGYLRTCNRAAEQARGEFLLFLNSDTQPLPGWLDPMVELMRERPDAGAVGSKLLHPDGRLQEAGGIIWNDGRGWTYGRDDDPDKSAYCYVREVDYVSGASLLVRRDLFARLGGFDETFAPAYCEDSDLAFRIRAAGLKVLYQPRSRVIHFESVTNGRDPNAGIKRFNDINHPKLVAKWSHLLETDHFAPNSSLLRACQRARRGQVVLLATDLPPPAGSTLWTLMRARLSAGDVVKLWVSDAAATDTREALQRLGVEVLQSELLGEWVRAHGREVDRAILAGVVAAEISLPDLRLGSGAEVAFLSEGAATVGWRERAIWRAVDVVLHPTDQDARAADMLEPAVESRVVDAVNWPMRGASLPAAA